MKEFIIKETNMGYDLRIKYIYNNNNPIYRFYSLSAQHCFYVK